MDETKLLFYSGGCNRTTQALAWSQNQWIAYGCCNSVVVYYPNVDRAYEIVGILNQHKSRVNCVQWLESNANHTNHSILVSGSSDGSIIVWKRNDNCDWEGVQTLLGHASSVVSLDCLLHYENNDEMFFIVSSSSDSTAKIWKSNKSLEFSCCQTLTFGNGFAHTVAISILPESNGIILACGCDDTTVKLYTQNKNEFINIMSLKGHEDWIRCLAFKKLNNNLMLASGSQDMYIRLWKVSINNKNSTTTDDDDYTNGDIVSLKEQMFSSYDKEYMIVLDSVLIGHEGWVLGISWDPSENSACLLSASMDRTLIVWEYSAEDRVWLDKARMGEVGGNTLGYYGCAFGPHGNHLIGHGYHGAFNLWKKNKDKDSMRWEASITISGHFNEVEDFDWDPFGEFLITASTDQTTRLFAPWQRNGYKTTWHEIARPQIHGYDMKCIVMLNRYKYISAAQEKVARVFSAPKAFYNSFTHISNITRDDAMVVESLPLGATVPVLGLSNKAVYEEDVESWDNIRENESQPLKASAFAKEDPAPFNPKLISEPPVEDVLIQNTLWPEIQKLYGHGFELFCMASTPDGSIVVTACKASKVEHANILAWDTSTWTQTDNIQNAHSLTITQMCFSPNGKYLLSVSRDRTWALHERDLNGQDKYKFSLVQKTNKKSSVHSRIIWSCDWLPCNQMFATASRDKKVIIWGISTETQCWCTQGESLDVGEAVTAVSCYARKTNSGRYVLAIGTESGKISIYTWLNNWVLVSNVNHSLTPSLTVKRLRWRHNRQPETGIDNTKENTNYELGACSSDHSFRILKFNETSFI